MLVELLDLCSSEVPGAAMTQRLSILCSLHLVEQSLVQPHPTSFLKVTDLILRLLRHWLPVSHVFWSPKTGRRFLMV